MSGRRRSASDLPRAPLELAHPFRIQGPQMTGAELLADDGLGEHAVVLLRLYRLLLAWTDGHAGADGDALRRMEERWLMRLDADPLAAPLAILAGALADPKAADRERVARACVCVCEWAIDRGAKETAIAFARLAALTLPRHSRYAWMVARLLYENGRPREAEPWYHRAHRVAVWTDDWEAQAKALNSLGVDNFGRGRFPTAKYFYGRAIKVAGRHGEREIEAIATHNLFVVHAEAGEPEIAEHYALRAYELYGPSHPRLPMLVGDCALHWNLQGYYWRTLPIFRAMKGVYTEPLDRIRVAAGIARAAGGTGNHDEFTNSWIEIQRLSPDIASGTLVAGVYYEVGIGAANLRDEWLARDVLQRALDVAQAAGAAEITALADVALARLQQGEEVDPAPNRRPTRAQQAADLLANDLAQSLELALAPSI